MSTVLVADDDLSFREMLRTTLERDGHNVLEAGSAGDVFRILDTQRPDVMLLDVHLGADDGIGIGVGLRKDRRLNRIKIVFMTGTLDQPELTRMSRLLKAHILAKPIDPAALAKAVAHPGNAAGG